MTRRVLTQHRIHARLPAFAGGPESVFIGLTFIHSFMRLSARSISLGVPYCSLNAGDHGEAKATPVDQAVRPLRQTPAGMPPGYVWTAPISRCPILANTDGQAWATQHLKPDRW